MIIKTAEFVTSQVKYAKIHNMPEIAVVGRSNVGKSSLINMLAHKKKLARTSSEPGRTRLINYFNINEEFMLVDLPGYGFAKGAKTDKQRWGYMIEEYLKLSSELRHVLILIDIRHEPSDNDKIMLNYLYKSSIPFTIIATKSDKLSKNQLIKAAVTVSQALGVGRDNIILSSADTRLGEDKILEKLDMILAQEEKFHADVGE